MIRLKSGNVWYLVALAPLWAAVCILGGLLANSLWLRAVIAAAGLGALAWLCRKVLCLPRPAASYTGLEPLGLALPVQCNVRLCLCGEMARYEFLHRTVELVTPLRQKAGEPFLLAVNPELLRQEGEGYVRIAAMREIERCRRQEQLKTVLGLLTPLLGLALLAELAALARRAGAAAPTGVWALLEPTLLAAAAVLALYGWNQGVSRQDLRLDAALKEWFTVPELVQYIRRSEAMLQEGEKEERRAVQQHFVQQRIDALRGA